MRIDFAGQIVDSQGQCIDRTPAEMGVEKEDDSAAGAPGIPKRSDSNGIVEDPDDQDGVKQRDSGVSKSSTSSDVPPLPPTRASRQSKLPNQEDYSINTANPPPPVDGLMERDQYLQSGPGAVAVGGSGTAENESTVDGKLMESISEDSNFVTVDLGLVNAEPIEDDLREVDEEGQQNIAAMVAAEPIDDEKVNKTFLESVRDRRFVSIVLGLLLVATALATGLLIGLRQETSTKTFLFGTNAPTPVPITSSPSSSPTMYLEFDPPSPEECRKIADGLKVMNQQNQFLRNFDIQLDVSVSRNTVADDYILSSLDRALQRNLAPSLAGCDEVDFQQDGKMLRRRLLRKNVVSNAVFKATFRDRNEPCQPTSPDFCKRVVVTLELYLKGEERIHKLLGLIANAFDSESLVDFLGLQPPFRSVQFAAIKSTDPTESPTQAPTVVPSNPPTPGNSDDDGDHQGSDQDDEAGDDQAGDHNEDDHFAGDDSTGDDHDTDELLGGDDLIWDDATEGDDDDGTDDDLKGDDSTGGDLRTDDFALDDDSMGTDDFALDDATRNDDAIDDFLAPDLDDILDGDDDLFHIIDGDDDDATGNDITIDDFFANVNGDDGAVNGDDSTGGDVDTDDFALDDDSMGGDVGTDDFAPNDDSMGTDDFALDDATLNDDAIDDFLAPDVDDALGDDDLFSLIDGDDDGITGNDNTVDDFFANVNGDDGAVNGDDLFDLVNGDDFFFAHDDTVQFVGLDDITGDDNEDDDIPGQDDVIKSPTDDWAGDDSPMQDDVNELDFGADDVMGGDIPTQGADDFIDDAIADDTPGQDDAFLGDDGAAGTGDDAVNQDDNFLDDDEDDDGTDDIEVDDTPAQDDATADDDTDDLADDGIDDDHDDDFVGDDHGNHGDDDFDDDDSTGEDDIYHLIWGDDDI